MVICLSGCVTSGPKNNVGFEKIEKIADLEGVYRNRAEGESSRSRVYLSPIIWPDDKLDHETIKSIEVRVLSDNELYVKAHGTKNVVKESVFVEGKDFTISNGRIQSHTGIIPTIGFPQGIPFMMVGYGNEELGIDEHGNGKYRNSGAIAGTAFLYIPFVGGGHDDYRFVRIGD